jgi:hypothetical protein
VAIEYFKQIGLLYPEYGKLTSYLNKLVVM